MPVSKKILSLSDLAKKVKRLKAKGEKIVHCHGCFDLMHPGHIKHFEAAKKLGDILVVTVTPDTYIDKGPGRPVFNQRLRLESIAALEVVDFVALNDWPDAVETIKLLRPNFFVKDKEFEEEKDDPNTAVGRERQAIESIGGKLHLTSEISFSSSRLLNEYFGVHSEAAELFLREFRQRYSSRQIIEQFEGLKKIKVLVIGDTIIDEYCYSRPMGKTPKAHVIAANYEGEECFAGGILASANHIAGFCDNVHLITCLGKKNDRLDFIKSHLKENINLKFFFRNDAPTVIKRRFIDPAFMEKLFELYIYNDRPLPLDIEDEILVYLNSVIKDYDLVLVNDFGHGFLDNQLVSLICNEAKFLAVNTQANAGNYGFNIITKYSRADYICLDAPEARLACRSKFGDLRSIQAEIARKLRCQKIIITRGHLGTLARESICDTKDCSEIFWEIPVFSNKIIDTVGAGDALFSITSPCALLGWPIELVAFVGNVAGALAVAIVGNRSSVEPEQMFQFITTLLK